MTTLDDVYEQMRLFERALREFNEEMRASADALAKLDGEARAIWQDESAQRYRQAYQPLADMMERYLNQDAPRFERFLEKKTQQLERYLHGA